MSAWNWVMDKTAGAYWDLLSDTVNPWKLDDIKKAQGIDIARAKGPGASPAEVQAAIRQSVAEIESHLKAQGQHPDQANWDVGKEKILKWAALAVGGAVFVYVLTEVLKAFVSRRR